MKIYEQNTKTLKMNLEAKFLKKAKEYRTIFKAQVRVVNKHFTSAKR